MTKQNIAITVIGPDRPGLIHQVSSTVTSHNANWLDSHMANLAGQFAGIVQIEVPADHIEALVEDLKGLNSNGLQVQVAAAAGSINQQPAGKTVALEVVGQDHPGIVSEITAALASHNVGIEELSTGTDSASMAGGVLFQANASLRIPDGVSMDALENILHSLSDSLMVDITIEEETDRV